MAYSLDRMDGARVLVTGGLGFIGSNVAQRFVSLGARVTIVDACLDPYGWNEANVAEIRDRIEIVKGDIRDLDLMTRLVDGQDVVVDAASQISHVISIKDPFLDVDINCRGALTVLEAARRSGGVPRMIYASTRGVVGRMVYSPIDERHPTEPVDMNGIDKLAAEKYYRLYGRLYDLPTTILRINNTYGVRSQMRHGDYGIVNWFVRLAMENRQITINGTGEQTRDYNYVEDVADAFVLAAQSKAAIGETFWLGSGTETRFVDMCRMILRACDSPMTVRHRAWDPERKAIEIGNFVVTIEKIRRILGWEPQTSLESGLVKTVEFYRARRGEYF